jgi:uncharacterized membrane protein
MAEPKSSRLYMLAFTEAGIPPYVLELIKEADKAKEISVSDWAMIRPDADGKPQITTDESVDPGKGRGALFGGGAGLVLAGLAGPIGAGAILAGAAIGAVTAGLRDSGIKDDDLRAIAELMKEGRSGLVVAVPLEDASRFEDFMKMHVEFQSVIRRVDVDVVPGHSLAQAIEEYRDQPAQPPAPASPPG